MTRIQDRHYRRSCKREPHHEGKIRGATDQSCNSGEGAPRSDGLTVDGGEREGGMEGQREGRKLQDLEIIQPSCRRGYSTDWRAKGPLAAPGRSLARLLPTPRALI